MEVCLAGADGFEPPVAESESAALPLGEAPIWQELMESNHRLQIWRLLFSSLN